MRLENLPCNLCGATAVKVLGLRDAECFKKSAGRETDVRVVKCRECGLIYANPMPIYTLEDSQSNYLLGFYNFSEEIYYRIAERRYRAIIRYKESGNILDMGCGEGYLLKVFSDRGWNVHGIDISPHAAGFAKQKFGLDIFVGELSDACLPPEAYDVVVADQLLEHLPDPISFLTEVKRILKKEGLLFMAVPNEAGLVFKASNLYFKLLGRKWTSNLSPLYAPYHIHGFSPNTLSRMLGKIGFQVLKVSVYSGDNSGMDMYHPILRLGRQTVLWLSQIIRAGNRLEVYAIK